MNKVYLLSPNENWICDRIVTEFRVDNPDIITNTLEEADVIWLYADWCWRSIPRRVLTEKKVITTVHHIVPEKFGDVERRDFDERDSITDIYHVYNQHTFDFIENLTHRPIKLLNYWANQRIWKKTGDKYDLRKKNGLPNQYLIGSFVRDTEGSGIERGIFNPKLEKGPDLFCDLIENINRTRVKNTILQRPHVVLAGWRRQYVINRLKDIGVSYTYFERPQQHVINELYQTLDLYPVTARYEGGPQSLIECGLLDVYVISRPVGIAEQVLDMTSIHENVSLASPSIPNVEQWKIPRGYYPYRKMVEEL